MYDRFAAVSRATRDAAAAAEIRFATYPEIETYRYIYAPRRASGAFARRNADRVTSLGPYMASDFASIRMYSQLRDLELELDPERESVALLPRSLTKLDVSLHTVRIDWESFRPLCCLQELKIYSPHDKSASVVQLDDKFATALPLLRVFLVKQYGHRPMALETTAKVVMPHLVELDISHVNIEHLDLYFMTALKSLRLVNCTVSTVIASCSTIVLVYCRMGEGTVLVTPNLRSLTIHGGLQKLDGSKCRHALSIVYYHKGSVNWVGAKPNIENLREMCPYSGKWTIAGMVASV